MNANFLFWFILFWVGVAVLMVVIGYIRRPRIPLSRFEERRKRINTLIESKMHLENGRILYIETYPSKAVDLKRIEERLRQIDVEIENEQMIDDLDKSDEARIYREEMKRSWEWELEKKARNGDLIAFMEWKALKKRDEAVKRLKETL